MVNKLNQHAKIWAYIKSHGSITPMDAFHDLHITKLSTRVGEMIKMGYKIKKILETQINDEGTLIRYMRYMEAKQ